MIKKNDIYLIDGAIGKLEVALDFPKEQTNSDTVAVICHPHPLFQGTMNNKVVTTIAKAFNQVGILAARFNYRGVGKSDGNYDDGIGEINDLISVVSWLRSQNMAKNVILAGFSFGGAIAYKGSTKIDDVSMLLMVSPSTKNFNLNQALVPKMPLFVILSEDDEVIDARETFDFLINDFKGPYHLLKLTKAGHFFHGRLIELRQEIYYHYQLRLSN
ncbi:alpha/beta hydrolase [Thiotrichales bacterium 19S9-12]|nr:alpha/beta hydrolase [Thiotrichales bacterium 19S9-11]MCF6810916.1 alpha/beta hydrolase [Thiotrichales bacterium 19S9-12]